MLFFLPFRLLLCVQVNTTPEAREHVSFLQSILAPYIEGYWCVAVQLRMLWEQQQNIEDLHKGTVKMVV